VSKSRRVRGFSNYKASRDIPKACREIQSLSPTEIVEWIKTHRTERHKRTGTRVQKVVTPQAISMFFKRHPEVERKLQAEIVREELPKEAITERIFENGCFQEVPSIKQYLIDLTLRGAKKRSIGDAIRWIRRVCQGKVSQTEMIEGWGIRHPDNITLEDAKRFIYEMKTRKMYSRNCAIALRNYFRSRGTPERVVRQISGAIEEKGKYAHLKTTDEKMNQILGYIKALNFNAYQEVAFAYMTGARKGGAESAIYENVDPEDRTIIIFEKATRGRKKRKVKKAIPLRLWNILDLDNLDGKSGKMFKLKSSEVNALLKSAYEAIIPEIADKIPMVFHFLRHQFAQTMLKKTKQNYTVVAKLGGWTTQVLEDYYGALDLAEAREIAHEALESL
jgi:integrase